MGAGGAAHLPGMVAANTVVPVLGVPVQSKALNGLDSLLSIVQMPGGVPVGTMAIGTAGALNAGLLAAAIVSRGRPEMRERLRAWREARTAEVLAASRSARSAVRVGVLGGGQLGLMLAQAAARARHRHRAVDPATDLPPLDHGERVATAFDDPLAFELLSRCDVVTVELEGVPVAVLDRLAAVTRVAPPAIAVAVSQDRLVEKRHFPVDRDRDGAFRRHR